MGILTEKCTHCGQRTGTIAWLVLGGLCGRCYDQWYQQNPKRRKKKKRS